MAFIGNKESGSIGQSAELEPVAANPASVGGNRYREPVVVFDLSPVPLTDRSSQGSVSVRQLIQDLDEFIDLNSQMMAKIEIMIDLCNGMKQIAQFIVENNVSAENGENNVSGENGQKCRDIFDSYRNTLTEETPYAQYIAKDPLGLLALSVSTPVEAKIASDVIQNGINWLQERVNIIGAEIHSKVCMRDLHAETLEAMSLDLTSLFGRK